VWFVFESFFNLCHLSAAFVVEKVGGAKVAIFQ